MNYIPATINIGREYNYYDFTPDNVPAVLWRVARALFDIEYERARPVKRDAIWGGGRVDHAIYLADAVLLIGTFPVLAEGEQVPAPRPHPALGSLGDDQQDNTTNEEHR